MKNEIKRPTSIDVNKLAHDDRSPVTLKRVVVSPRASIAALKALIDLSAEVAGKIESKPRSESSSPPPGPRHFEKTVEWAFVQTCLPEWDFAAPLAGTAEEWGDAMAKAADQWLLIEFKATEHDIGPGEKKKYPSTSPERTKYLKENGVSDGTIRQAKLKFDELMGREKAPHVLVFGKLKADGSLLSLEGRKYWSWANDAPDDKAGPDQPHPAALALNKSMCRKIGVDYLAFKAYAGEVVVAKAGKGLGRGRGFNDSVVGLKGGVPVVSMPVDEFLVGAGLVSVSTLTAQAAASQPPNLSADGPTHAI
ncbi:hypothetical protein PQQ86_38285 [Paraburkholderia sediminicola]|uniref:hypothetical protein n=1 Tax=Paraburkholderia sediminicola TaxID=458836 RepID=UPI0038B6BFC7